MLSIQPRIFNISIEYYSLSTFLSSFLFLMELIEGTKVFSNRYDILGFQNFLYLPQIMQHKFFIFSVTINILVLLHNYSYNH